MIDPAEAMVKMLTENATAQHWTPERRIEALTKLVAALSTGMTIVQKHRAGAREPHPGAVDAVIRTSLYGVELARRTGLLLK